MSETILSARNLRKIYVSGLQRLEVLRDVSLAVHAGESLSIRGESGSGKSTILNLLAGLDAPDAGELLWAGQPAAGGELRAKFLGIVFQSFYLIPELNALDNVLMAARIRGKVGAVEQARAKELLAKVGLAERATHVPARLSGGERQRVAVARAMMNQPRLILADEPTGNLDEKSGDGVVELLLGLCRDTQTALVLVTHNAAHAAKADQQLLLRAGVIEAVEGK